MPYIPFSFRFYPLGLTLDNLQIDLDSTDGEEEMGERGGGRQKEREETKKNVRVILHIYYACLFYLCF